MLLSFKKNEGGGPIGDGRIILAGDIGATKTNLALFQTDGDTLVCLKETQFKSREFTNITEPVGRFLNGHSAPESICLGVAGPVLHGRAKLSNLAWDIDQEELSSHFRTKKVNLINDLEATGYGLAVLDGSDISVLHAGNVQAVGNAAVIAPGTGLGEAGIFWDGEYYHPFATEGGHSDFAPRDKQDMDLYFYLLKKFGHVSWERLVSGPGIVNIFEFLRDKGKMEEPGWLKAAMNSGDKAAVISQHAGETGICTESLRLFIRFLAFESANLVLKLKATGGLYIGGGIVPRIVHLFAGNQFDDSYLQSGRLNYLLDEVPVKIILNPKAALLGAAWFGAYR